jgi:hypothetical protein
MYFAAGFKSGVIRVFDIENTSILFEGRFHEYLDYFNSF